MVSHRPSAPSVPSRLHARQMAAAIREAMPNGDVQSTADTILPMTVLKTCRHRSWAHTPSTQSSIHVVKAFGA